MFRMFSLSARLWLIGCAVTVLAAGPGWAKAPAKAAAKPPSAKQVQPESEQQGKPEAKPNPPQIKPNQPQIKPISPLRQDELLARILAALDKAVAAKPAGAPTPGPDLAEALLVAVARSSLVSVLHGHFALAGLGHSLRSGAMKGPEVAVMAGTMAQNYRGLTGAFAMLAQQKAFDGELAEMWKALGALAGHGLKASEALGQWSTDPADGARLGAFDAALEEYRTRLQTVLQQVQGAQSPP